MNGTGQFDSALDHRRFTGLTVSLGLRCDRWRIGVITSCQRVASGQITNRVTTPHTRRDQAVRHTLLQRTIDAGQQARDARIGLRHLGGAGVEHVIEVVLYVVLQPVQPVALIKEIAVAHQAFLDDCRVVVVVDEHVAVFRGQGVRLRLGQRLGGDPRLLLKFQGDRGVVAQEIDGECPAKNGCGSVRAGAGILRERPSILRGFQLAADVVRDIQVHGRGVLRRVITISLHSSLGHSVIEESNWTLPYFVSSEKINFSLFAMTAFAVAIYPQNGQVQDAMSIPR